MHADKGEARLGARRIFACPETPALAPVSRQMQFSKAKQRAKYAAVPPSAKWAVFHPARKVVLCTSQKDTQSIRTDLSAY